MRLKLIGNATMDDIYDGDRFVMSRAGGIFNVSRHLTVTHKVHHREIDMIRVQLSPSTTYKVDRQLSDFSEMSFEHTFWTHISYLDQVELDMDNLNTNMISADICLPEYDPAALEALFEKLSKVGVLIIGSTNLSALGTTLDQLLDKVTAVILRTKELVLVAGQRNRNSYPNRYIEVINDVGAGDAFVAEWLNYVTTYKGGQFNMKAAIARCVDASVNHLKEQNV